MTITINIPRRVVWFSGAAHDLSRAGANRLLIWLTDNAKLRWGFDGAGEYVFNVEVQP